MWAPIVWAQQFSALEFGRKNGLDDPHIRSIVTDSIGFVWIASDGGLLKLNGDRFEPMKDGIASSYVRSLVRNKRNEILFSCDDGVYSIQSFLDTAIITQMIPGHPEVSDSSLQYPNKMYVADNGILWISEPRGSIVRVGPNSFQRFELGLQNTGSKSNSHFSFVTDRSGRLWVASQSGTVFGYQEDQNQFIEMFDADRLGTINHILYLDDGHLLLLGDQIYRTRINQNGFLDNLTALQKLPSDINHALQGLKGLMYFGTDSGLYRATYQNDFEDLERVLSHNDPHRIGPLTFGAIYEIRQFEKDIWLSTDSGVGLLKQNFFGSVESLPMEHVYSVSQVSAHQIYVSFGDLYKITATPYGNEVKSVLGKERGFIHSVEGKGDSVWAGNVNGELLFLLKGRMKSKLNFSRRGGAIFHLLLDSKDNLWICQAPADKPLIGVAKLTNTRKVVYYGPDQGLDQRNLVVKEGPSGRIFAAGKGGDNYLYQHNSETDSFHNLSLPLPFTNPRFKVHDLAVDMLGIIWLGTTDGLLRYDFERIERVDLGDFTNVEIRGVTIGADSSIWVTTDVSGVLRFSPGSLVVFDESSGLPSKTGTYRTLFRDEQDRIWVGTAKGLAPSQMPNPKPAKTPSPLFLSILANGQEIDNYLPRDYPGKSVLEFKYSSNAQPTSGLQYMTRMSSKDRNIVPWRNQGGQTELLIPPLSFGEYLFQVRARQPGGFEWSDSTSYQFIVKDVWYRTQWAYGCFILAGMLLLWGLFRAGTYKLRRERSRLQLILNETTEQGRSNGEEVLKRIRGFSKFLDRSNRSPGWTGKASQIFGELKKIHAVDSFGIGTVDPDSGEIQAQEILSSNDGSQRRSITISGTQNYPVDCVGTKKEVWVKNLEEEGPAAMQKLEFKEDKLMNTLLYLPLKVNNKAVGYISIKSIHKNAYDEIDVQTFKILASIIAMNKK